MGALRWAMLFALCSALGCRSPVSQGGQDNGGAAIESDIVAYLSEARALHHEANLKEDASDVPGAVAALERLVHAKRPREGTRIPEVEEVLADTFARLAELRLRGKDTAGARADVRAGLEHAREETYFRGHLLEVSGIVDETLAADLAAAGKTAEAAEVRARALGVLEEAVSVQQEVIARSLAGDGGEGGRQ
jgi:hypothetical protein